MVLSMPGKGNRAMRLPPDVWVLAKKLQEQKGFVSEHDAVVAVLRHFGVNWLRGEYPDLPDAEVFRSLHTRESLEE